MPDLAVLPTERLPKPCSVEVFRRTIPGDIKVWYYVREVPTADRPNPDPLDIIAWDQQFEIVVIIQMPDGVRRHLCGKLCVDIDVDTCGPAPDVGFPQKEVDLTPCKGDGRYVIVFPIAPNTLVPQAGEQDRCGRVYRICVTVGSHDICGGPGLIWGHCDSVEIAVHPPVPNP
jgi:hypothetical protein